MTLTLMTLQNGQFALTVQNINQNILLEILDNLKEITEEHNLRGTGIDVITKHAKMTNYKKEERNGRNS